MRTADQVKWDFVQQWLSKAHKDLQAAGVLLGAPVHDYESAGFHAQQAAEKFIKAMLVRHQVEFPRTHDIGRLRDLVGRADSDLAARLAPADSLTPYAIEFRYPGELGPVPQQEGMRAVRLAEATRDAVLSSLKTYLDGGRPHGDQPKQQL